MGDLDGRTFLITGANTGIGKETARALAARGGGVIFACRSAENGRRAVDEIAAQTGNHELELLALRTPTRTVSGMREYSVSKLANVLHAQELARRLDGTGVTTYSLHPGVIASDIWRRVPWPVRGYGGSTSRSRPPSRSWASPRRSGSRSPFAGGRTPGPGPPRRSDHGASRFSVLVPSST